MEVPFRTDLFPGRRERSERDLLFDDDNGGRKKGKTQDAYEEYADLYAMFEHLKSSTRKRDQYVQVTTPGNNFKNRVLWIKNILENLEDSKKENLEKRKEFVENEKKQLENNKKDTTDVDKQIISLQKQINAFSPSKEKEIDDEIAHYKALESEKIDLWVQMETIIAQLAKNNYVKARFLNFRHMNETLYKDGLYDLILD